MSYFTIFYLFFYIGTGLEQKDQIKDTCMISMLVPSFAGVMESSQLCYVAYVTVDMLWQWHISNQNRFIFKQMQNAFTMATGENRH